MTEKECFINVIENYFANSEQPPGAVSYFNKLKNTPVKEKPLVTEKGKIVLDFLKANPDQEYTAKDIAEELQVSSRQVSGSARKLITDNFVEKTSIEGATSTYKITDDGKNLIY